jgi:hypothetical protein
MITSKKLPSSDGQSTMAVLHVVHTVLASAPVWQSVSAITVASQVAQRAKFRVSSFRGLIPIHTPRPIIVTETMVQCNATLCGAKAATKV